jgi:hypothetical protein
MAITTMMGTTAMAIALWLKIGTVTASISSFYSLTWFQVQTFPAQPCPSRGKHTPTILRWTISHCSSSAMAIAGADLEM